MSARPKLIVSAPRGSGGAYTHLAHVIPRFFELRPEWDIEVHSHPHALEAAFGTTTKSWMRPIPERGYRARLHWEFVELPKRLAREPNAVVYAPFGPPLNLGLAPNVVWMSRNIIPLLPIEHWEVSDADRPRLAALRVAAATWARAACRTVCVSRHARRRLATLARIPQTRIAAVAHGIDTRDVAATCESEAAERIRTSASYLFHVGQPVGYRRTRELLLAYSAAAQRSPTMPQLVLAGGARPEDSEYERACMNVIDGSPRICALGQLQHRDTLALMQAATAFVYPSVHEDCPNVVLEALALGRACVFADIEAVRELAGDAALYATPDPQGIAAALERLLADASLRARLEKAASERARAFTWDRTAAQTAAVLDDAIAEIRTRARA